MSCYKWIQIAVSLILLSGFGWFGGAMTFSVSAWERDESFNISHLLNALQIGYDKRVRPNYGGIPVTVGVSLYILSIEDLSEKSMDFTFDMYFRQFWHDPRLAFMRRPGLNKLVLGYEFLKNIWVPDTFFVNEKEVIFHHATVENQFLRITHNGDVLRSIRLTVKAGCPMDLAYFPMDNQMCSLEIETFGYTMSDLRFRWEDGMKSVQMSPDVGLPQFTVIGHRQRIVEASLSSGNYSRLLADVQFTRSMGYYIIQVYIPSSLIVMMSFVSFWLNREACAARAGLAVITVLTMITLISSVNATVPKTSYMKSIDIYLGICLFLVFGTLIEYAMVAYMEKKIEARKNKFLARQKIQEERTIEAVNQMDYHSALGVDIKMQGVPLPSSPDLISQTAPNRLFGIRPSDIDKVSRVFFPGIFTSFHLIYWIVYLRISDNIVDDLVYLIY